MTEQDRAIVQEFRDRIAKHYKVLDCKLFGSRAVGQAAPDSDYDVFLLLEKVDSEREKIIQEISWEVGFRHDVVLSVIPYSIQEVSSPASRYSLFLQNVRKEGIAV